MWREGAELTDIDCSPLTMRASSCSACTTMAASRRINPSLTSPQRFELNRRAAIAPRRDQVKGLRYRIREPEAPAHGVRGTIEGRSKGDLYPYRRIMLIMSVGLASAKPRMPNTAGDSVLAEFTRRSGCWLLHAWRASPGLEGSQSQRLPMGLSERLSR
jgi:hypothetical protein